MGAALGIWPDDHPWTGDPEQHLDALTPTLATFGAEHQIPSEALRDLAVGSLGLAAWLVASRLSGEPSPFLLGVQGAQGSGKSTLSALLAHTLRELHGLSTAVLSLDDFYLTRAERRQLAETVHPLFITRGVPGTHDVPEIHRVIDQLGRAKPSSQLRLPRFDKALDDRAPIESGALFVGRPDVIVIEGWCLGTPAEPLERLKDPLNPLESLEDPDARWRGTVNHRLATDYARLVARLDALIFLKIPDFSAVFDWRSLQESKLNQAGLDAAGMTRFIQHFERLTRWSLIATPKQANWVLSLDDSHTIFKAWANPEPAWPQFLSRLPVSSNQ